MNDITVLLASLLIIGLMIVKWRLGLYSIIDRAIAWIKKKRN
jgi:hypothetical protein